MPPQKLTGWLILLIIILSLSPGSVGATFTRMDQVFQPYLADHPAVGTALMVYKLLGGAAVCASFYTAWVLFRREPGTLRLAKTFLIVRCLLISLSGFSVPVLAGLSPEATQRMMVQATDGSLVSILFTAIWFAYLSRSDRVAEIYAA